MASLTWFWFCFLCTYFGYTFFFQKMVLINLNAIFPKKIFCNFSCKPKSGNCVYIWTVIICIFHLLRNKANCNHKPTFFLGITTRLLLSLVLLCGSRFLKKKKKTKKKKKKKIPVWNLCTFFKVGIIMVSKYGHLMLPEVFLDKITLAIDFIDQAVVQCDVLVVKILL